MTTKDHKNSLYIDKIERLLKPKSGDAPLHTFKLLKALYDDSKNLVFDGLYFHRERLISDCCDNNPFIFNTCLEDLEQHGLIYLVPQKDAILLKAFSPIQIREIFIKKNSCSRFRLKNINFSFIESQEQETRGFRLPCFAIPFITGKPIEDKDLLVYLNQRPDLLEMAELRRNLTKEIIRVYCALFSISNKEYIIETDSIHSAYQSFVSAFGKGSFNHQTWYNSIEILIQLKLLEKIPTGLKLIDPDFGMNSRYIMVPVSVFDASFKKLSVSQVRMFFYLLDRLNNGEDGDNKGNPIKLGSKKELKIKAFSKQGVREASVKKLMLMVRKRYPGELINILSGENSFISLKRFFDFKLLKGAILSVTIRAEYFISKSMETIKDCQTLQMQCKKKLMKLAEFFTKLGHKIDVNEMQSIWRVMKNLSYHKWRQVLEDIRQLSANGSLRTDRVSGLIPAMLEQAWD